jgi:hypothetical protein
MNDLRPQKTGWKQLNKMKKKELLDEIKRLDEVVQITARRFNTLKNKAVLLERSELIEMNERFTIEEIAEYITGWHLSTESGALANALSQLRDDQDGILAVRERNKARHAIHQFLHNSQDHSSQKD